MLVPIAWIVFALVALMATLSVTEMVRVFAHRLRAVDRPGGRRVHRRPTARLGGLGIYWGFYFALALGTYGPSFWRESFHGNDLGMIGMMVGSSLLLIVGVMDDVYGLKATLKLGFQFAAAFLLYGFGWRVETIGLPGVGAWETGALSLPFTVAWVLLVTNAVNLIDGLDGLACGVALVATLATCAVVAPIGGQLLLVAAALAGALLGFLWFNLNPALIFMGDAGSLFIGFVLSAITLRAGQLSSPESFPLVPVLLLMVPLYDTCDAIRRRTVAAARTSRSVVDFVHRVRGRLFAPDGLHVHHRLVRAGLSTRRAVMVLWLAAATFAVTGCLLLRERTVGLLLLVAFAALTWHAFRLLRIRLVEALPAPLVIPSAHPGSGIEEGEAVESVGTAA
jgi:UDP-GlcNAc:undecaprenyl-phosphate/decaprenyl-phosphate GlcNAc-1-phosphate transferase